MANTLFANVATYIGEDWHMYNMKEHPSIQMIHKNLPSNTENFSFRPVLDTKFSKFLSGIVSKKSTAVDNYMDNIFS